MGVWMNRPMKKVISIFALVLFAAACLPPDDLSDYTADASADASGDTENGPRITDIRVEPATFTESETGMTDEEFERIEVVYRGLDAPPRDVVVFLQEESGGRIAPSQYDLVDVDERSARLEGVEYSYWLSGLTAGEYDVGASIVTQDLEAVTTVDYQTIEITRN